MTPDILQKMLKLLIKILKKVTGLYGQAYNFDAFREECKKVKGSKQAKFKEISACLKALSYLDKKKEAGIGDVKDKLLLKFWKKVISKFPGLCIVLKSETEAKRLLDKAEKDLDKLTELLKTKNAKTIRNAVLAFAAFWGAVLLYAKWNDKKFIRFIENREFRVD